MVDPVWRHIPDVLSFILVLGVHYAFARWTKRPVFRGAIWALCTWVLLSLVLSLQSTAHLLPGSNFLMWFRGTGIAWGICSLGVFLVAFVWRKVPKPSFSPERRRLLTVAHTAAVAAPAAVIGYGVFIERHDLSIRETRVTYPGLPRDLEGLRIVQLTDIHRGAFVSAKDVARAVDMANDVKADIAVVTGDLITAARDPLDDCLRELSRLRAASGIYGCLGNHEIVAHSQLYTEVEGAKLGIRFLRGEARKLKFGDATVNLSGVDYQKMRTPYLRGAEKLVSPGDFNLLLSHNPDVFPIASAKGFQLTISGHTHGGQIGVEILSEQVSVARFFTPYVYGLYQNGGGAVYVSRGIGTVGVPARIGAPPEVSVIRLCAI